jgi:rhodanese-related sulfurtransferase
MASRACREDVRDLQAAGAQILEVLPREEYRWKHIAGAISLPLTELDEQAASRLDRSRPVVTYCNDFQ